MKKEKLISLLLTGVITVTMFAGCGKQNDSTEKKEGDGKFPLVCICGTDPC